FAARQLADDLVDGLLDVLGIVGRLLHLAEVPEVRDRRDQVGLGAAEDQRMRGQHAREERGAGAGRADQEDEPVLHVERASSGLSRRVSNAHALLGFRTRNGIATMLEWPTAR